MPTQKFYNLIEHKKARITEAIIDVFSSKGIDEADIADIVRTAKIARGSFYQYFEDKDDAIFHIINKIKEDKFTYLQDIMNDAMKMPFFDFYYAVFMKGMDFASHNPKYLAIGSYLFTSKNPKVVNFVNTSIESFYPFYEQLIEKDKEAGLISKDISNKSLIILMSNATSDTVIKLVYEQHTDFTEVRKIFDGVFHIIKKGITT
jgi:AcrR family transcriptional regulator